MSESLTLKPYELTFESRPGYLFAEIAYEKFNDTVAFDYMTEIAEKCRELNVARLLIERSGCEINSNIDSHRAVASFADMAPEGLAIAVVDTNESNRRRIDFGARTAEKNTITIRVFNNLADAESWLITGS